MPIGPRQRRRQLDRIPASCCGWSGSSPRGRHGPGRKVPPVSIATEGVVHGPSGLFLIYNLLGADARWRSPIRRSFRAPAAHRPDRRQRPGDAGRSPGHGGGGRRARRLADLGRHVEPTTLPFGEQFARDFLRYWATLAAALRLGGPRIYGDAWDPDDLEPLTNELADCCGTMALNVPATIARLRRFRTLTSLLRRLRRAHVTGAGRPQSPTKLHRRRGRAAHNNWCGLLRYASFTAPQNVAGAPAITLPGALCTNGTPIGVHLGGAHGSGEAMLLGLAYEFEAATRVAAPTTRGLRPELTTRAGFMHSSPAVRPLASQTQTLRSHNRLLPSVPICRGRRKDDGKRWAAQHGDSRPGCWSSGRSGHAGGVAVDAQRVGAVSTITVAETGRNGDSGLARGLTPSCSTCGCRTCPGWTSAGPSGGNPASHYGDGNAQADERWTWLWALSSPAPTTMVKPLAIGELVVRWVPTRPVAAEGRIDRDRPLARESRQPNRDCRGGAAAPCRKSSTAALEPAATRGAPCRARSCYGPSGVPLRRLRTHPRRSHPPPAPPIADNPMGAAASRRCAGGVPPGCLTTAVPAGLTAVSPC